MGHCVMYAGPSAQPVRSCRTPCLNRKRKICSSHRDRRMFPVVLHTTETLYSRMVLTRSSGKEEMEEKVQR
uniref:Uncharacterized protein n=1 Tax=Cucumis melo TaxID=3656 RepID=A0A9I9EGM8_CUCME